MWLTSTSVGNLLALDVIGATVTCVMAPRPGQDDHRTWFIQVSNMGRSQGGLVRLGLRAEGKLMHAGKIPNWGAILRDLVCQVVPIMHIMSIINRGWRIHPPLSAYLNLQLNICHVSMKVQAIP